MPLFVEQAGPARFWNRTAVVFACGGLFAYLVSLWLFETRSAWVLVVVSTVRLLFGVGPAALIARRTGWRPAGRLYSVALAMPYPIELALFAYAKRFQFLPRDMVLTLSGPTAFLIFVIAVLLVSRWITVWALPVDVKNRQAEALRRLGGLLFWVTAVGGVLVPPPWNLAFLHYVPEPIALIGYSAIVGRTSAPISVEGKTPLRDH